MDALSACMEKEKNNLKSAFNMSSVHKQGCVASKCLVQVSMLCKTNTSYEHVLCLILAEST